MLHAANYDFLFSQTFSISVTLPRPFEFLDFSLFSRKVAFERPYYMLLEFRDTQN